jgi:hypothetical protein
VLADLTVGCMGGRGGKMRNTMPEHLWALVAPYGLRREPRSRS